MTTHRDDHDQHDQPDATAAAPPSRRRLLHVAAATAAGAVGAAALGRPASAANGDPVLLGQDNSGTLPTRISNDGPFVDLSGPGPVALELESPGGHLRFIGAPGDTVLGTYEAGTLAYNSSSGLEIWQVTATTPKPTLLARPGTAGAFTFLAPPERVYDSRPGSAPDLPSDGVISAGQTRTINLLESGTEQIPENVDGVMVNLTVTQTVGGGFLSLYSAALSTPPTISSVNWSSTGQTVANLTVTAVELAAVKVTCGGNGSAHFIIDVLGTYG
jgi:hypothetical protein